MITVFTVNSTMCQWGPHWVLHLQIFSSAIMKNNDIITLFKSPEHVPLFANYLSSKHKKIKFTFKTEKNCKLPFLYVNIFRENGTFVTTVYRKDTFSGVYTNFTSFLPQDYKFGLIFTLLHRCFALVSDFSKFHLEIEI